LLNERIGANVPGEVTNREKRAKIAREVNVPENGRNT
jgi:hypothetical protein